MSLAAGYGGSPSNQYEAELGGATVTASWAEGASKYTYGICRSNCNSYTQIIWAATTDIGCGYKRCNNLQYTSTLTRRRRQTPRRRWASAARLLHPPQPTQRVPRQQAPPPVGPRPRLPPQQVLRHLEKVCSAPAGPVLLLLGCVLRLSDS